MVQNVITVNDFNRILDDYAGRLVSHTPITRTYDNISGEETLSEGSASNIKCYFMLYNQKFDFQKAGFVEKGDAVALCKYADGVTKDDKITADGNEYRVKEAFDVPGIFDSTGSSTEMVYTSCNLFKIS